MNIAIKKEIVIEEEKRIDNGKMLEKKIEIEIKNIVMIVKIEDWKEVEIKI